MIFKLRYSERAADDLEDIINYISDELCSPQAAEHFFNAVDEKLGLLREHPYMFPLYHDEKLNADGVRFAVIGNYLLLYLVDDENSVVNIARILHGRRDILSVFEE